ncbi:SDR family oxidoreductase [uncultured Roseobacter sp.]|uniref:SDR family oxidoreductase n=1 Tax=uncultured Roseobacter sp. TaxID=114847 RepID=UPI00260946AE|nr:SDR family oxidoreductase [uncultured Roseobacter sp.]
MLEGKTALVTGGSSGIGFASAKMLKDNGARVAITGTNAEKLHSSRKMLGGGTVAIQADVSKLDDLDRMQSELRQAFGKLDILFANAGVAFNTPLGNTDEAMYYRMMDVNVKGTFFSVQSVLPLMPQGASIILNTSWLNQIGTPNKALLSASKAAVRSFSRVMSAELSDRAIRVNCVSPGTIETPIHRGPNETDEHFKAYVERIGQQVPVGRMGKPEDIASAVLFLASDASSYMLGTEMVIDGGRAEL